MRIGSTRIVGFRRREEIGTPLVGSAPRLLLLGSGELGREVAIEAMRLGAEVIAVDRYANAPAMQVAHRSHVIAMTDGAALREVVRMEAPDVIVPEIEQIDTHELVLLEAEGWTVVPGAEATQATMDRELIRRLAAEKAKVPTSRFAFADDLEEARRAAAGIGFPCVFKSITSSSGHGMTIVRSADQVPPAYAEAAQHGRVANPRVMVEEFIAFDSEVTILAVRHLTSGGGVGTTVLAPIGHARPDTLYHESWQPAGVPASMVEKLGSVARAVTSELGGIGVFGVECFLQGSNVYFSEVSPRPHDTGLVTLGSQWNSEFAIHARVVLGLPYEGPEATVPAAAHVILSPSEGEAPTFGNVSEALSDRSTRLFLFGKPEAYPGRRLGVAIARGEDVAAARVAAERAAHLVESQISMRPPKKL